MFPYDQVTLTLSLSFFPITRTCSFEAFYFSWGYIAPFSGKGMPLGDVNAWEGAIPYKRREMILT